MQLSELIVSFELLNSTTDVTITEPYCEHRDKSLFRVIMRDAIIASRGETTYRRTFAFHEYDVKFIGQTPVGCPNNVWCEIRIVSNESIWFDGVKDNGTIAVYRAMPAWKLEPGKVFQTAPTKLS